jgi:hypothetical protein
VILLIQSLGKLEGFICFSFILFPAAENYAKKPQYVPLLEFVF